MPDTLPPPHPDAPTDDEYAAFVAVREEGREVRDVAREHRVRPATIIDRLARYELKQYGTRLGRKLGRRKPARISHLSALAVPI